MILALVLAAVTAWLGFDSSRRVAAIENNKRELTFRSSASEALRVLKIGSEAVASERLFLDNILPPPDKIIDFPKDIQGLARINKVDPSFNFGEEVAGSETAPGQIAFSIIVKGGFNNLVNFIKALEQSRYLIRFDVYNLTVEDQNYQAMINGKVFSQ